MYRSSLNMNYMRNMNYRIIRTFLTLNTPPLDNIMASNLEYQRSLKTDKMNMIIGAYRQNDKPYIFDAVSQAKYYISTNAFNHEYLPITGDEKFNTLSTKLYFGNNTNFRAVQTLSGTGSLYLLSQLLSEIVKEEKTIYIPNPTWENHFKIFHSSQLSLSTYEYLQKDRSWSFAYLYNNVQKIPDSNIILFHGCAHNPSGFDPTKEEWKSLIELCERKNMLILIDMAYLGFASGNIEKDSSILKIVNNKDYPVFVCSSYAKNFGLYSERVGNLFFRGISNSQTSTINDILRSIIRKIYSSPPSNGSNIIKTILSNEKLNYMWLKELVNINNNYCGLRNNLRTQLENKLNNDFSDITKQKGMFWYSKLTKEQVELFKMQGIFMPQNGRISLSGFNESNISKFADIYAKLFNCK